MMTKIVPVKSGEPVETVRTLFREYRESLGVDLCFQGFEVELAGLPGDYAPPTGRLFLALEEESPSGCVGIRKISDETCELKRLYVRPLYRGKGIGRQLVREAVKDARRIGYLRMRLDTLPTMKRAQQLYISMGFKPIPPYRDNPVPGADFLELEL
jgi:GNAT superfamily N-acetyltransferase